MKVSAALLSLVALASAINMESRSLFSTGGQKAMTDPDSALKVPGKNPLYVRSPREHEPRATADIVTQYCADPKDYIGQIQFVDLDPNPPKPYVLSSR
jgi:hypothetical protein